MEAAALGAALTLTGAHVTYLDANLNLRADCDPRAQNGKFDDPDVAASWKDKLKKALVANSFTRPLLLLRGIVADQLKLRRLLKKLQPAAIVIFDDRRAGPDLIIRRLAEKLRVPTVLAPFAISSVESDVFARREKSSQQIRSRRWRLAKGWIKRHWPGQIHSDPAAGDLLFFEPLETLVLGLCGVLPKNPWLLGGSSPEVICVTGQDHRAYLVAGGVDPGRIVMTGQPSLDRLMMTKDTRIQLHDELCTQYNLPPNAPFVICAVPQHAEHGMADWTQHRQHTDELFSALKAAGASVLLSLHPKSRRSDYAAVASKYGLPIAQQPLIELLPAADLLVATFSSTIQWAIGLGIPAMVIDAIGSEYRLYEDLPGVVVLRSHSVLAAELTRFVKDPPARREITEATKRGATRVGQIDGRASARVADAIKAVIAGSVTASGRNPLSGAMADAKRSASA